MGNSCSNSNPKIKASGITGIYDISKINKGILSNSLGEISNQLVNESILLFQSKLLKAPDDFYANLHLGICLYKQGFYEIAESHLQASLRFNETFSSYYILGLIYMQKSKIIDALNYFKLSIQSKGDFVQAYIKLSELYLKINDINKAKETLKIGKKIDPQNSEIFLLFGLYYKHKQNFKQSNKYLEKSLKETDDKGKCHFYIGEVKYLQGL